MFTLKLNDIPDEGLDLRWKEERASLLAYFEDLSNIDFDFETPLQSEAKIKRVALKRIFLSPLLHFRTYPLPLKGDPLRGGQRTGKRGDRIEFL